MSSLSRRLERLPTADVLGREVRVAAGPRARLLGLSRLDRERAGSGLLIPRCAGVHTFGMRFALDLVFLDRDGRPCSVRRRVPPRRFVWDRGASSVLELPWPPGHGPPRVNGPGVMHGFAEVLAAGHDAWLVVAGPSLGAVTDDPDGAAVLAEVEAEWRRLPAEARARVLLASLPMRISTRTGQSSMRCSGRRRSSCRRASGRASG